MRERIADHRIRLGRRALAGLMLVAIGGPPSAPAAPAPLTAADADAIAIEAYSYAYPLVLMELTRRVSTNVGDGAPAKAMAAPMNQFAHMRAYPDATFTDVVRPNADTLYSTLWFDVGKEPLIIEIPDSGGRYWLLPMLDMWTDVFASPGTRTSGNGVQRYALTGPGWTGVLPDGVERIAAPTAVGWILGRTQTNGKADYAAVHAFQDGFRAVPLTKWGKDYTPPRGTFDPNLPMRPPPEQMQRISVDDFLRIFTTVTKQNPPHSNDGPILQRLARIGLVLGTPFDVTKATPEVQAAMRDVRTTAAQSIFETFKRAGMRANGWRAMFSPVGTYGTDYRRRHVIAIGGLGANVVEDALYYNSLADADGKPLESSKRYTIHFDAGALPPVRAFWSISMYNDQQFFSANRLNRFAIGDRDPLKKNADGSLDLYVQQESPGPAEESNWLPAPGDGGRFSLTMRLYWPDIVALDGIWLPPPVTLAK